MSVLAVTKLTLFSVSILVFSHPSNAAIIQRSSIELGRSPSSQVFGEIPHSWLQYLLGNRHTNGGTSRRADSKSQVVSRPLTVVDTTEGARQALQPSRHVLSSTFLEPQHEFMMKNIISSTMQGDFKEVNTANSISERYPDLKGYDVLQEGVISSIQNLTTQIQSDESVEGSGVDPLIYLSPPITDNSDNGVDHPSSHPVSVRPMPQLAPKPIPTILKNNKVADMDNVEMTSTTPSAALSSLATVFGLEQPSLDLYSNKVTKAKPNHRPTVFVNNQPMFVTKPPKNSSIVDLMAIFDRVEQTTKNTIVQPESSDLKSVIETALNDEAEKQLTTTTTVSSSTQKDPADKVPSSTTPPSDEPSTERVQLSVTTRRTTTTTTATTTTTTKATTTTTRRPPNFLERMGQAVPMLAGAVVAGGAAILPFYLAFGRRRRRRRRRSAASPIWPIDLDSVFDKLFSGIDYVASAEQKVDQSKHLYKKQRKYRKKYIPPRQKSDNITM